MMEHGRDYRRSQSHTSSPWTDQHNLYPHSHHGTPAQEYMAYNWGQPPLPDGMPYQQTVPDAQYSMAYDQRLDPPMPQWPSQLTGDHSMYKTVAMPPLQSIPLIDPFASSSMPSASGPSNTPNPRRTLTDDDRRDMCRYAEAHPNLKQIEIGGEQYYLAQRQ